MSNDKEDTKNPKKDISIIEKIKFWEEQDRINKTFIPRVLKMHEMITELSKTVSDYSQLYAKHEARIKKDFDDKVNETKSLEESLKEQSKTLTALSNENKIAIRKIEEFKTKDITAINNKIDLNSNESNKLINEAKTENHDSIKKLENDLEKKLNDSDFTINENSNKMNKQILLLRKRNNYLLFLIIILGIVVIFDIII